MNTPYLVRYRNGEFLQYMTDVLQLIDSQNAKTLKLEVQVGALQPLVTQIDNAYKQSQGSHLTQEVTALDETRDRYLTGIRSVIEGYTYHYDAAYANAAKTLLAILSAHGERIQKLSYREETAVLDSIFKDFEDHTAAKAVQTLHLTTWIAELKASNARFTEAYLQRVSEAAAYPLANVPELRLQATEAYRALVKHIQAHRTLGGVQAYTTLVNEIDVLAGQYNQVIDNRRSTTTTETSEPMEEETVSEPL